MNDGISILLDVDDVLADWMGAVNDVIERATGRRVTPEQCRGWLDFNGQGFTKTELDYIMSELNAPGFTEELRPLPGALEGVTNLIKATGCHVGYVTAPWHSSETWHAERLRWLRDQGFMGMHRHTSFFATKDKWLVGPGVLIDDKVQNIIDYRKYRKDGKSVLWRTIWNDHDPQRPGLRAINTWTEVQKEVEDYVFRKQ